MHKDLLSPLRQCETTRRRFKDVIASVPTELWFAAAKGCGWTAAQFADHLLLSEVGTSKMVRRLIRGDFVGLTRPPDASLFDSTLSAYPYPPLPAPQGLVPSSRGREEVLQLLEASHRRFALELEAFRGDSVDEIAAPDPATSVWFTLAGWVRLQALHEAHHIEQLEELLRMLGVGSRRWCTRCD